MFLKLIREYQEDMLIPPGADVWVLTSPRYMPVYEHAHDFVELIYVYSGECRHQTGEQHDTLVAGDCFILSPHVPHKIECTDDDCVVFHIMVRRSTFDTAFLSLIKTHDALSRFLYRSISGKNTAYFKFAAGRDDRLRDIALELYSETLEQDEYTYPTMNTLFQLMCLHLAKYKLGDLVVEGPERKDSVLLGIFEYIALNYNEVTLSGLAKEFCYSEGHIRRLILASTGKNFKEVVTRQRLVHAKSMLMSPDASIMEIAEKTGFGDIRNLQRSFRRYYGMSPVEYRKELFARQD